MKNNVGKRKKRTQKNLPEDEALPSPDILESAWNEIDKHRGKKADEILKLAQNLSHFNAILNQRLEKYREEYLSKAPEKEISQFDEAHLVINMSLLEISRFLEASIVCILSGYFESSLMIWRPILERNIKSLYFSIDNQALHDWLEEKSKIPITGPGGMIDQLSNPKYIKSKAGSPAPILERELSELFQQLYSDCSDLLHGKIAADKEIIEAYWKSEDVDQFTHRFEEIEKEYIEGFLKTEKTVLDFVILNQLSAATIVTKGEILRNIRWREKRLQEILTSFPASQEFVSSFREKLRKMSKRKNKNFPIRISLVFRYRDSK